MELLNWFKSLLFGAPTTLPGVSPFRPSTGPARLIVLRHAEKTGDRRDRNLSPAGHERAARLVPYVLETFGRPDFLIAAKSSDRSRRPVETIEPLGSALSLEINSKFDDDEVERLVASLGEKRAYRGKFGVISWRHSDIPRLVATLGAPADSFPGKWGESDYTTLVDISYSSGTQVTAKQLKMPF
ncbi:MAG: phosphoglycerate mutase family protein [Hyphomicrobiaceae bacterium]